MSQAPVLNVHMGKAYVVVFLLHPIPQCLAERYKQELTLYHYMAQRLLTHPRADQSFCFRALGSNPEAIAVAAAKWVLGIKSEFARPAPITVDAFYIHLKGEQSSSGSIMRL